MLFRAIVLLLFVGTAHAQQPLTYTEAIVVSIFGTLGVVLLCIALALLYFKLIKKKKKRNISNSNDVGHDNPVLSNTEDTTDANGKDHNAENGEVQTKPQDQNAQMDVFTVLMDEKESPTNGFDLMPGENGNVQVANIRRNGPAHDKLKEGDVIESVTVFFDDITYQDALTLLSNSAPYKVAITASHNQRKEPETMTVTDEFQESAADAMLHAAPENRSPEDVVIPSNDEVPISYEELQTKSPPPNIGTVVLLKDDETKKSKLSHPSIDDDSKSTSSSSSYSSANDKNEHIYSKVSRRASTSSSSSSSDSDDEDRREGGVGKDINGDREPTDVMQRQWLLVQ
uniref:pinin-like isoform X2 n=1 Tax=Ciona intestinalis TaxID=7719 RepID=UPI000EF4D405|nr:pinin-like isoform X2 [Ciona intestinalis]|eukprot:XP_026689828.1 pinin-like isoform X2 [Ciona intestinalis]